MLNNVVNAFLNVECTSPASSTKHYAYVKKIFINDSKL